MSVTNQIHTTPYRAPAILVNDNLPDGNWNEIDFSDLDP